MQKLLVHSHVIDALLGKFKGGEENGVDDAGARHGDPKATVHAWIQELDFGSCLLVATSDEAVTLVDALRGVDGKDLPYISPQVLQDT